MAYIKSEPEDYARALLAELGLKRVNNLADVAARLNLKIREVDSRGFEGALIRSSKKLKGIIAVKRDIREPGRKKFTVSHEIGHFILPGHGVRECHCKSFEIESWRKNVVQQQEIAANRFASEFLLPAREIYEIVKNREVTIDLAQELSAEFETSLTATTLKCVEVTEEPCALVFSIDGNIKWRMPNENFRCYIRRGRLDTDSLASKIFQNTIQNQCNGSVPADVWLEGDSFSFNDKVWEDSIFLPFYKSVLTVLTLIN